MKDKILNDTPLNSNLVISTKENNVKNFKQPKIEDPNKHSNYIEAGRKKYPYRTTHSPVN